MGEWRRVSDGLPPEDGKYLVFCPSADPGKPLTAMAWHHADTGWSLLPPMWVDAITHWMPLPAPPEAR